MMPTDSSDPNANGIAATIAEHQRLQPSETYHRVHRSYMLAAGLLAAWEILGITPRSTGETPGIDAAIGAGLVTDVRIGIETPDAAVYILIVLLVYFSARFSLVWWSEPAAVRSSRAVTWDYRVAHGIAAVALVTWALLVYFTDSRLGEILTQADRWVQVLTGAVVGAALMARTAHHYVGWRLADVGSRSADGSRTNHLISFAKKVLWPFLSLILMGLAVYLATAWLSAPG